MSQWLDMQPGGSAYTGDWGTGTSPGSSNAGASVSSPSPTVKVSENSTMLYLTGAGVLLAAFALFKRGK